MSNEIPKLNCWDEYLESIQEQITSKDRINLPAKEQVAKQPDEMPDVIYALKDDYQTFWTPTPIDSFTPYIRKSIHDETIFKLDAAIVELKYANRQANELIGAQANANDTLTTSLNDETTKLKSALKECVELLEWVGTTGCGCESSKGFLDTQKVITSAKGLYE